MIVMAHHNLLLIKLMKAVGLFLFLITDSCISFTQVTSYSFLLFSSSSCFGLKLGGYIITKLLHWYCVAVSFKLYMLKSEIYLLCLKIEYFLHINFQGQLWKVKINNTYCLGNQSVDFMRLFYFPGLFFSTKGFQYTPVDLAICFLG